jgi:hypothetical protein
MRRIGARPAAGSDGVLQGTRGELTLVRFGSGGIRPERKLDIIIFCGILENISTQMSHFKQQRRTVLALFSVQTTA